MKKIEVIVPCFNEQECIEIFYKAIETEFAKIPDYDFTILFVDDGSKDDTLLIIKQLEENARKGTIRYISFSRNFGKEAAICVGMQKSKEELVVIMDADLQHPPTLLPKMIQAIEQEGYDCCAARRVSRRGESIVRKVSSNLFYQLYHNVTGYDMMQGSTDYRIMTRQVVEAFNQLEERERFTKGIYSWIGFNTKWIEYENVERVAGNTKWSFSGLVHYALNGFMAFSTTPLRGVVYLGILIVALAIIYAGIVLKGALMTPTSRTGYSSIILVMLLLGGTIITILGMIGEYLARIYLEIKHRPIYIIKESNLNKEEHI